MKERIIDGLQRVKLDKYFQPKQVYSFDLVDKPKPDPDIYLKAIEDNNLIKAETIIIEDSAVGVTAGVKAGIKVIGFTAGGHWFPHRSQQELLDAGADLIIDNYTALLDLCLTYPDVNFIECRMQHSKNTHSLLWTVLKHIIVRNMITESAM